MVMMRHLVIAACAATMLPATAALAQNYRPVYGPVYVQEPGQPQPTYYNRVIVTQEPMPPDLGRPYPYTSNAQPGIVVMPPAPAYAPPPRGHHRVKRAAKPAAGPVARRAAPELITELKKRTRIKSVAVEDTTGAIPQQPAPPSRHKAGKADVSERVIRAEAEVRIIGNDQMSIRLFRKRPAAQASAD